MVEGQAQRRRARRLLCRVGMAGLLAAGCLLLNAGAANASGNHLGGDPCAAWPGEPKPLPRTGDADPLLARWAALRVRELSLAATAAETGAPVQAHRLWRRVLCLEPASDAAAAGLARTPLVAVHHPPLVASAPTEPAIDAWADLDRPLAVRPPTRRRLAALPRGSLPARAADSAEATAGAAVTEPAEPEPPPDPARAAIEDVQEHLRAARFEEALVRAERGRRELGPSANPQRAAELEVLSATAALALDRMDEATESLRRALAANPMLTLDPMQTPPKVRRAFDRVRAGASL